MNLANNHILDYYERGLFDTMDILDKTVSSMPEREEIWKKPESPQ